MRRVVATVMILSVLLAGRAADARGPRLVPAASARDRRTHAARATPRLQIDADGPASAFECDTPRGVRAFGSSERCLRALCVDRNLTNAYVLDAAQRVRRNPCAGLDPFEQRR